MNTFGLQQRRWVRSGWLGTQIRVRGPLIALLAAAAFGCSFALGRVSRSSTAARGESPPSLAVATVSAAIPARLSGVQPLESTLLPPPPPKPAVKAATPAPAPASEAPSTPAPRSSEASPPAPAAASPPAEQPAPAPAPAPAPRSAPSGGGSQHAPASPSGGSFESSG
jgi:hypothetical protein